MTRNKNADEHSRRLKEILSYRFLGPPTYKFKVGDIVIVSGFNKSIVSEVIADGLAYKLKVKSHDEPTIDYEEYFCWTSLFPYKENNSEEQQFSVKNDIKLSASQRTIESLLNMYRFFGIDTDVEYQRGFVWGIDQKLALIESIFENIQIGSFTLSIGKFEKGKCRYEIIDGKQRLLTLVGYRESRFPFRGKLYKDLCPSDRNHFEEFVISYIEVSDLTNIQKYRLFIRMNTCGKPQDKDHIEQVRQLLKESEEGVKA